MGWKACLAAALLCGWKFLINVLTQQYDDWLAAWPSSRLTGLQACWLAKRAEHSLVAVFRGMRATAGRSRWKRNRGVTQSGRLKSIGIFFLNERECRWKAWECSQSRDKKRQEKWGGSETGSDRDRKRCLIKKGSFSCHHQERLWQPAASVSEKKRQETSSPDSHTSRSIGTGDFRSKDRKGR